MSNNHKVLVDQFVKEIDEGLDATQFKSSDLRNAYAFELFSAQCVLRRYNLSDEELESGIVGGGDDGALDGIFTLLDDVLIASDHEVFTEGFNNSNIRKGAILELHLIQAKREDGFKETPYDLAASSLERLLQSRDKSELRRFYSEEVIDKIGLFYDLWAAIGTRVPSIKITFHYCAKASTDKVHQKVIDKGNDLCQKLTDLVPGAVAEAPRLGAKELWKIASIAPDYSLDLKFLEYVTGDSSYSGLVSLSNYYAFIADENKNLRGHLFDWNVRDYQGSVVVNSQIAESLDPSDTADFWWLNNGVTVLSSKISIGANKTFTLDGVQIVNGLQTSHTIHESLSKSGRPSVEDEKRFVQVKVIQTVDEVTRDRIIRATNSQTKVPDASLHATEEIHRQIEAHFHTSGWFYDRRKNFYKNQGKPSSRIISISSLGQAVMAMGLSRPNDARTRPTSLLNDTEDYKTIFDPRLPLALYLWTAVRQRQIESAMKRLTGAFQRTNYRFHVSLYLATKLVGSQIHRPAQLIPIIGIPTSVTDAEVMKALQDIEAAAATLASSENSLEKVSKTRDLVALTIQAALLDTSSTQES